MEALVDSEPNCLDSTFRDSLFQRTAGPPWFTVKILRMLEKGGILKKDAQERWVLTHPIGGSQRTEPCSIQAFPVQEPARCGLVLQLDSKRAVPNEDTLSRRPTVFSVRWPR
jgi:hypothetical protein